MSDWIKDSIVMAIFVVAFIMALHVVGPMDAAIIQWKMQ